MSLVRDVRALIELGSNEKDYTFEGALADAERMAEQFSDVRPQPYVVPIERFAGLPVVGESRVSMRQAQKVTA